MSITRALMSFFLIFPTVMEGATQFFKFRSKEVLERVFNFEILLFIRIISSLASCRTIQGVIVLVISKRRRASRSSDFEITRIVVYSV